MSTGGRRYYVPHFILPQITRCPGLFSRSLFRAFYPLAALPHPALPQSAHRFLVTNIRLWHVDDDRNLVVFYEFTMS